MSSNPRRPRPAPRPCTSTSLSRRGASPFSGSSRDLRLEPAADLDTILDSHLEDAVERVLEPWLGSKALRDLLEVLLNAILYSTSVEARPELLPAQSPRPAGERLVLSGESVFYLPDKIEVGDRPLGDSASSALDGDSRPLRSIQHRVGLRGHWRRPHPQATDRRLRWIRPHFSGPREAVLLEREYRVGEGAVDNALEKRDGSGVESSGIHEGAVPSKGSESSGIGSRPDPAVTRHAERPDR
jgi:hypothetical protein